MPAVVLFLLAALVADTSAEAVLRAALARAVEKVVFVMKGGRVVQR